MTEGILVYYSTQHYQLQTICFYFRQYMNRLPFMLKIKFVMFVARQQLLNKAEIFRPSRFFLAF